MDQGPARGGTVWLAADEVVGRAVVRDCREGDDQVAEFVVRLEPAAGADAEQLLHAELDQLLEHDRRAGATHPGSLHGNRLALVRPGIPEQATLRVALPHVVEVRLRDVFRAQRVAGEQACFGVLARLGTNVNRHGAQP